MFNGINFLFRLSWKLNKKFIFYEIIANLSTSLIPFISIIMPKYIIDELLGEKRIQFLFLYLAILVFGNLLGGMLSSLLSSKVMKEKNILFNKFQLNLTDNLVEADLEHIESSNFLTMKEKAYKYLYGDGKGFASVFDEFSKMIGQIITFLGVAFIISTLNYFVVLCIMIVVILSTIFEYIYQNKQFNLNMEKVYVERKNGYFMNVIENFEFAKEIRIYNMKKWLKGKYGNTLEELNDFYNKLLSAMTKIRLLRSIALFLEQGVIYFYLIISTLKGTIGIGSFTMYLSAIQTFSSSIKEIMSSFVSIKIQESYFGELKTFLDLPKNRKKGKLEPKFIEGNENIIEFQNVSFIYPNQDKYSLDNISISLNLTDKMAIVGENGAGKSTFIKLLLRLYEPTCGRILLNGIDIKEIDYDEYMKLFSVVFQDFKLFAFSIKENISLGSNINEKIFKRSMENSGIYKKVETLQKGIDTNIYKIFDDKGIEFSGGESQKIAIARAIYKDAPIIVLDEPTAALDPRAEYELYKNFDNISKNKSVIYISHRLGSTKFCDKILVFKSGRLIEVGSHDELIKSEGLYNELFSMQSNQYKEVKSC